MADQRFDPLKEINNLRQAFFRGTDPRSFPLADIYETDHEVMIRTEPILGLVLTTLEVSVEENVLILRGETANTLEDVPEEAYIQRELAFGKFERKLHIPRSVDPQQAKATYKQGIVQIVLPKLSPPAHGKIIAVTPVE